MPRPRRERCFLYPGSSHEAEPLPLPTNQAGEISVRATLTILTDRGLPVGRWTQQIHEEVREDDGIDNPALQTAMKIHRAINAGHKSEGKWVTTVPIRDERFAARSSRLRRGIPAKKWPSLPTSAGSTHGLMGSGRVIVRGPEVHGTRVVCVRLGASVDLGRGMDPHIQWQIDPIPRDVQTEAGVSRHHLSLMIADGLAWTHDFSRNGFEIGTCLQSKGDQFTVAHEDSLIVRDRLSFAVDLFALDDRVRAVRLRRVERRGTWLEYLLTTNECTLPLVAELVDKHAAPVQMGWAATQLGVSLVVMHGDDSVLVAGQAETRVGHCTVRWEPLENVLDQDELGRV